MPGAPQFGRRIAYEQAQAAARQSGTAAGRALAETRRPTNRTSSARTGTAEYVDAVVRTGAVRWAAAMPAPRRERPLKRERGARTIRDRPASRSQDTQHPHATPLVRRCTYGIVWMASAHAIPQGPALVLAVQPLESWRELWVFHEDAGNWTARRALTRVGRSRRRLCRLCRLRARHEALAHCARSEGARPLSPSLRGAQARRSRLAATGEQARAVRATSADGRTLPGGGIRRRCTERGARLSEYKLRNISCSPSSTNAPFHPFGIATPSPAFASSTVPSAEVSVTLPSEKEHELVALVGCDVLLGRTCIVEAEFNFAVPRFEQ